MLIKCAKIHSEYVINALNVSKSTQVMYQCDLNLAKLAQNRTVAP